ncbi:hypothetical protein UQW22_05240 [Isoptericola halotolerans]|uniref:hypothetical protein n=1 Tax=Isoptericola halotolerans TaxID=300560 RepID=UPI003890A302
MTHATTAGQDAVPRGRLTRAIRRHHTACLTVFAALRAEAAAGTAVLLAAGVLTAIGPGA